MLSFYSCSEAALLSLSMAATVCFALQAVAMVVTFNRHKNTAVRWLECLTEALALVQVFVLALLISQVLPNIVEYLIAESGYVLMRYGLFALLTMLSVGVAALRRSALPLALIPAVFATLPVSEQVGVAFRWLFALALAFWIIRAVCIIVARSREMRSQVSAFSVKQAMDSLHSGLLYYRQRDGRIYLVNRRMQRLMTALTGLAQRNGADFHSAMKQGKLLISPEALSPEEQEIYRLDDGTAWLFREYPLETGGRQFIQLSAVDVTRRLELTRTLHRQRDELEDRNRRLREVLANIESIRHEEVLLQSRSRVHDMMAQRLAFLMRALREEIVMEESAFERYADNLLAEAAQPDSPTPEAELEAITQAYEAIGVTIVRKGELPDRPEHAAFYVDLAREGISNAVRHGYATTVCVLCEEEADHVRIEIQNTGLMPEEAIDEGGGITELRRKAAALGGTLTVTARPKFTLTAQLPKDEQEVFPHGG